MSGEKERGRKTWRDVGRRQRGKGRGEGKVQRMHGWEQKDRWNKETEPQGKKARGDGSCEGEAWPEAPRRRRLGGGKTGR